MAAGAYELTAEVVRYPGVAAWHFVTLPTEVTDEIQAQFQGSQRAFGSLPVSVALGHSVWTTSLFFDTKSASYLLPVKADVRRREHVDDGDTVTIKLAIKR
jgi:hypothetical protein